MMYLNLLFLLKSQGHFEVQHVRLNFHYKIIKNSKKIHINSLKTINNPNDLQMTWFYF